MLTLFSLFLSSSSSNFLNAPQINDYVNDGFDAFDK